MSDVLDLNSFRCASCLQCALVAVIEGSGREALSLAFWSERVWLGMKEFLSLVDDGLERSAQEQWDEMMTRNYKHSVHFQSSPGGMNQFTDSSNGWKAVGDHVFAVLNKMSFTMGRCRVVVAVLMVTTLTKPSAPG